MESLNRRDFIRKAGLATALASSHALAKGDVPLGQRDGATDIRLKCIAS